MNVGRLSILLACAGLAASCARLPPAPEPLPPDTFDVSAAGALLPAPVAAALRDAVLPTPGELYVEPATLHSLGFQWIIDGDTNRNAAVHVRYRPAGTSRWRDGMDLLRIRHEINFGLNGFNDPDTHVCSNLFAGSILFLEPATAYDVTLTMTDLDADASAPLHEFALRVRTKSEPVMSAGGRRLNVYPPGYTGIRTEPSFDNFQRAYRTAEPGDRILLHGGTYTGEVRLDRAGTRDKPIVIMSAGEGPVTWTSGSSGFVVSGDHHWIENIAFRVPSVAIRARTPVTGLTVRRCAFEGHQQAGVQTMDPRTRDVLVCDNTFTGSDGSWHDRSKHTPYKAVWVAGQGLDVCYNRVRNQWDGVSVSPTPPTDDFSRKLCAIDFYNNDIAQLVDDNEADEGQHNIRYFNNRFVDAYVGLSAQPVHGGPCYFVRNIQYNVKSGKIFKLNVNPAGVLIFNNTSVSGCRDRQPGTAFLNRGYWNTHVFNNVFLGIAGDTLGAGPRDPSVSRMDHNGYRPTGLVRWHAYDESAQRDALRGGDGSVEAIGRTRLERYASLAEFAAATSNELHAVELDFSDFVRLAEPRPAPANHDPDTIDVRLSPNSRAKDAGMLIPNITDNHTGRAPDLGAVETGKPFPHYGPRP